MKKTDKKDNVFLELLLKYHKRIYNFILLLVPNYPDADDIMQETVSVMWSRFDEFEPNSNFAAWGMQIARYKIYNFRKQNKRQQFSEESLKMIQQASCGVLDTKVEQNDALQRCLVKLPERDRKLITLRYMREMSFKRISEITGRSVNGLYHTVARIHRVLLHCIHRVMTAEERL